jgi:hypothetical protein
VCFCGYNLSRCFAVLVCLSSNSTRSSGYGLTQFSKSLCPDCSFCPVEDNQQFTNQVEAVYTVTQAALDWQQVAVACSLIVTPRPAAVIYLFPAKPLYVIPAITQHVETPKAYCGDTLAMDVKAEGVVQVDVLAQQSYASPSAEASESAGFYTSEPREQIMGDEQQPQQTQQLREQNSPDRQASRTSVSAEELQLAAQLTQGLAPMMAAHSQAQEQQLQQVQEAEMQPREPSFEDHAPNADFEVQTPHQDLHDQVQGPDTQYEDHIRDPEYQDQVQRDTENLRQQLQTQLANHEQELHHILQQQAQAQAQTPVESPFATPPMQHTHLEQQHVQVTHLNHQYQVPDPGIPPRKRSKISRACDECRRKKIKCDATSDNVNEPCSNCRRSSSQCLFSRVPQKRGPSKG